MSTPGGILFGHFILSLLYRPWYVENRTPNGYGASENSIKPQIITHPRGYHFPPLLAPALPTVPRGPTRRWGVTYVRPIVVLVACYEALSPK